MGEAIDLSLRHLSSEDIRAMVAYLKSVPPISDHTSPAAVRSSSAEAQATRAQPAAGNNHDLGLHTFESACLGCHSFDGSGAVWPHASLAGNRSVNDPEAVNLTQVLFRGAQLHTLDGPVLMPAFGAAYSDAEIAAVSNYVIEHFGGKRGSVTSADVRAARN